MSKTFWLGAALVALSCAQPVAAQTKLRALIVGISHYQDRSWAQLNGLKDADLMRQTLTQRFGASGPSIRLLPEKEATRSGIEAALKKLVSEAQPGDTVLFHYSGHGAVALADAATSPEDALSECIIPIDAPLYSSPEYPRKVVRDQFIEEQLAALVAKVRQGGAQGSVVFIFDCCHSGGLSRGVAGQTVRTNPAVLQYFLGQLKSQKRQPGIVRQHKAGSQGWVALSACRADQTAADAPTSFTMVLVKALQELPAQADYSDLMQRVGNYVLSDPNLHGGQLPQLAGDRGLAVLGGGGKPAAASVRVQRVEEVGGDFLLSLDKGSLMGLNPGTRLDVYPFGTRAADGHKLGEAVVDSAESYTSSATFTPLGARPSRQLLRDSVAWVTRINLAGDLLRVCAEPELLADKASPLHDDSLVKLVGQAEAQLLVRKQGNELELLLPTPQTVIFRGPADGLRQALFRQAQRQWLVGRVVAPQDLVMNFRPRGSSGFSGTVRDGQVVDLEVKNQRAVPLYLSLLNLSGEGALDVIYPPRDQWETGKPLLPGRSLLIPIQFKMSRAEVERGESFEGFKVVATSQPVDRLYMGGAGSRSVAARGGMANTLQYWLSGRHSRGGAGPAVADAKDFALSPMVWIRVQSVRKEPTP